MTAAEITVRGRPVASVFGSFGKGVPGSVGLSFGTSGGPTCDRGCPYHPASTAGPDAAPVAGRCYAARTERFRRAAGDRLAAFDDAGPEAVARRAWHESAARGHRFPWFRVSVFGGVPADPAAAPSLARLAWGLAAAGTPVHWPVETEAKRTAWGEVVPPEIAVRWSVPLGSDRWTTAAGPVSTVAGDPAAREPDRLAAARAAAAARRASTGRRCVVCPAVASRIIRTAAAGRRTAGAPAARCGSCRACSDPAVDVVFPLH